MFTKKILAVAVITSLFSVGLLLVAFAPSIEAQSTLTAQLIIALINKPKIYQVIQTDPYQKDAFCNKTRDVLLYAYCEGNEISNIASLGNTNPLRKPIMFDFFTDGEFATNPWWYSETPSSDWNVFNQELTMAQPNSNATLHTVLGPSAGPLPFTDETFWSFKAKIVGPNGATAYYRFVKNGTLSIPKGYSLVATIGGNWQLIYQDYVNPGIMVSRNMIVSNTQVSSGQTYNMTIRRDNTGLFSWTIDGNPIGAAQDNNFSSMNLFGVQTGSTPVELHLDDVNISITDFSHMPSGFFNLNDWNNSSGVRCQYPGTARLVCISQT